MGGQLSMTQALGELTVPEAAIWQQLTPITAYLWAMPLLGERVKGLGGLGVLLAVGGVAWGAILGTDAKRPAVESEVAEALPEGNRVRSA